MKIQQLLLLSCVLCHFVYGQSKVLSSTVEVKDSIRFKGAWITSIDQDTGLTASSNKSIATQQAVKRYIDNRVLPLPLSDPNISSASIWNAKFGSATNGINNTGTNIMLGGRVTIPTNLDLSDSAKLWFRTSASSYSSHFGYDTSIQGQVCIGDDTTYPRMRDASVSDDTHQMEHSALIVTRRNWVTSHLGTRIIQNNIPFAYFVGSNTSGPAGFYFKAQTADSAIMNPEEVTLSNDSTGSGWAGFEHDIYVSTQPTGRGLDGGNYAYVLNISNYKNYVNNGLVYSSPVRGTQNYLLINGNFASGNTLVLVDSFGNTRLGQPLSSFIENARANLEVSGGSYNARSSYGLLQEENSADTTINLLQSKTILGGSWPATSNGARLQVNGSASFSGNVLISGALTGNVVTVTSNYTISSTEGTIFTNQPSASITITFPSASSYPGRIIYIRNISSFTTNTSGVASSDITSLTASGSTGCGHAYQSSGTNWYILY